MAPTSKKTEKLEIRLSPEAKAAFQALCQAQGGSASETIRALIKARWVQTRALKDLPTPQRAIVAACGIAAAGLGAISLAAAAVALHENMRLGLVVFLVIQGAAYAAIAACAFKLKWRLLGGLLLGQGVLQTVYGAEITPPAPAADIMSGLVSGMLSPTLLAALASAIAWTAFRRSLADARR